jgi:hypothetical protein
MKDTDPGFATGRPSSPLGANLCLSPTRVRIRLFFSANVTLLAKGCREKPRAPCKRPALQRVTVRRMA